MNAKYKIMFSKGIRMGIFDLYSSRNKPKYPELYQYTKASDKLRKQLVHIFADTIGMNTGDRWTGPMHSEHLYSQMFLIISREYGVFEFYGHNQGSFKWLERHIQDARTTEEFLDILELTCKHIELVVSENWHAYHSQGARQHPDDAINEINERMRRDGFGYEYTNGQLIRVDSQYVHAEVVKPALSILDNHNGAREEFLSAHEHYRHNKYEECLVDCNKAFESLMKSIYSKRGWDYQKTATAKKLIRVGLDNGLIPSYLQEQFNHFSSLLESGIPTIRNKEAGHGQGESVRDVPKALVKYALHLTATNVVFLGDCDIALG
ncbi:HEPN domain-containing protein [Vibrio alginolyticus]|uniref:STM4504/CBY_0614 family protein n=1 Tax=Vibrio alginolyticus TaxID=663 RepID=UPI002806C99F|nr:HEPN domain-containing protein [Vibrio alginolyticus]ELA8074858.1 HEPN domain-containing protein [Vibrio alginolyticus]ELB2055269.1 HEPN domain-containing protein [Vibrio parahaemolyticus]